MNFKYKIAVAAAALLALSGAAVTGSPAQAAPAGHKASPAAPAAVPPEVQICNGDPGTLCLNRASGGTGSGTNVIAWDQGDGNNDFEFVQLTGNCDHGHVSAAMECPFTPGRGLNAAFDGSVIVEIEAYNQGLCVADPNMSGSATLGTCPNNNGIGGATGTVFVLNENSLSSPIWPAVVINRSWSDYTGPLGGNGSEVREMAFGARGSRMLVNDDPEPDGLDNFWEVHLV